MNINFSHNYHKLQQKRFTTIRGKSLFKQLKTSQVIDVETPKEQFRATVVGLERRKIYEMDLAFLKADAEYPTFTINTVQDFVDLLNSFRAPMWTKVELDSEMTIVTLERI